MGFALLPRIARRLICALAVFGLSASAAWAVDPYARLIPHASSYGDRVDALYYLIYAITAVTFIGVQGTLIYFLVIYRARAGQAQKAIYSHGNNTLEVIWTSTPALILLILALVQRDAWMDIKNTFPVAGEEARVVRVQGQAQRFNWTWRYPGKDDRFGTPDDVVSPLLVVPVHHRVVIQVRSKDVLHSFFLPHFRVKQDAVPGLTIPIWFQPTQTTVEFARAHKLPLVGPHAFTYEVVCAELCGNSHFNMRGILQVVTRGEWERWIADNDPATLYTNGDAAAWVAEWNTETQALKASREYLDKHFEEYNEALHGGHDHGHGHHEHQPDEKQAKLIEAYKAREKAVADIEGKRWGWIWPRDEELQTTKEFHTASK